MLKICHLSDTQIRNFQRHWEYRQSFEHLYASLREREVDLIVIAGDIAHSKTHVSAEFFSLCAEYFKNLADIAPTVVVPGNHDGNLNNLSRMDALTPVVEALNHPNLFYYKNSGVYDTHTREGHVQVVVFSCFDDSWPTKEDDRLHLQIGNKVAPIVGLYHGMVKGAVLQNGQVVEDCPYTLDQFLDIVDYLMMGDIHRMQILAGYRAAYCGSYPQQNFGEGTDKGYLLWTIEDKDSHEVDFIRLPNVCPYYTLELGDDLELGTDIPIQEGSRIRIISRQLTVVEEQHLRKKIHETYKPRELHFKDKESPHLQEVTITEDVTIEDLSELGAQEKLLQEFLKKSGASYNLEKIFELNRKCDSAVKRDDEIIRNVQYKYRKMWWSNLFSYGEDNVFDFRKHKGIVGIFGKNAVGKSSLAVDIPLYIQFNTNSKQVVKNDFLINEDKEFCKGGLDIQIGRDSYRIERGTSVSVVRGKKKGEPVYQGRTELNFTRYRDGKAAEDKKGQERGDTDIEIRKIFGTAEDFVSTSVAPQWRLLEFIDKKSTERQKILGRYFDIDVFQKKHDLANKEVKEIKAELKVLERQELEKKRDEAVASLEEIVQTIKDLNQEHDFLDLKIKNLNKKALKWIDKKIQVSVSGISEAEIDSKIRLAKVNSLNKFNEIDNLESVQRAKQTKYDECVKRIQDFDAKEAQELILRWKEEIRGFSEIYGELGTCSGKLAQIEKSLTKLESYGCTTNKDCCMLEEMNRLSDEKKKTIKKQQALHERQGRDSKIINEKLGPLEDALDNHQELVLSAQRLKAELKSDAKVIKSARELLDKMTEEVKFLQAQKEELTKNKEQIKKNEEYQRKADVVKAERVPLSQKLMLAEHSIYAREADEKVLRGALQDLQKSLEHYQSLKDEYEAYEHYLRAMGKEGIPKIIVQNNLELLNKQMRRILRGTGLGVKFVSTKEVRFTSQRGRDRLIELTSGMEKTFAAIAIRAALINVTTLPKSNIFVLDEAFGFLDEEWLGVACTVLRNLRQIFETVLVITHNPLLKDVVDSAILVERDETGISKIR